MENNSQKIKDEAQKRFPENFTMHKLNISEVARQDFEAGAKFIGELRQQKYEGWAKQWDDKLPNLAAALRSKDLQDSCSDIEYFDGWILSKTSKPPINEDVLVTDGTNMKTVWMGYWNGKEWSLVYNGATPFEGDNVKAWTFMPSIPPELIEN